LSQSREPAGAIPVKLSFNAFNVSINGIVKDRGIPATAVGLALTTSTFAPAGFVMLGAKLGARLGMRRTFQTGVFIPWLVAITISLTQSGTMLFVAQMLQGSSIALAVPSLTVITARNYPGLHRRHGLQHAPGRVTQEAGR